MKKKKAYQNILNAIKKNKNDISDASYINAIINGLENRVHIQEVCELFDISDLPENRTPNYIEIDDERRVMFCQKGSKVISWPDDDRQPDNEYLYYISFPTGAYIFGDFYPRELFRKFFNELKTYNPKYLDSKNHCLFFSPENAKEIHENYLGILKKYRDMAGEEYRKLRADKLKIELAQLEAGS